MNRRAALLMLLATTAISMVPRHALAATLPKLVVFRNPGCGCCEGWVRHMKDAGFEVSMEDDPNLNARRALLKIPDELASCHIAMADGYAFEGHIPASDIVKFLNIPPQGAIGLVVPGMPMGSPGMGAPESGRRYEVLLLAANAAPVIYASH